MTDQNLTRRRFLGLAAGGVAAAAVLAACGGDDDTATTGTTTPAAGQSPVKDFGGKTITTAVYAKNHASSMLEWQRFAPPGLTVKPVIVTGAAEISRLLAAGELDFGLMGYYNTLIEATTTGLKAKVICMCSRQGIGLIARADRGIKTVADLKGKKVGAAAARRPGAGHHHRPRQGRPEARPRRHRRAGAVRRPARGAGAGRRRRLHGHRAALHPERRVGPRRTHQRGLRHAGRRHQHRHVGRAQEPERRRPAHRGGQDAARRGRVLHAQRRQRPGAVAQAARRAVRVHRARSTRRCWRTSARCGSSTRPARPSSRARRR